MPGSADGSAVNDTGQEYDYPERVRCRWPKTSEIVRGRGQVLNSITSTWCAAARVWNLWRTAGSHILHLLAACKCLWSHAAHSFTRAEPRSVEGDGRNRRPFDRLIVMSQLSSQFLQRYSRCRAARSTWCRRRSGLSLSRSQFPQRCFGVEGKAVLLTFACSRRTKASKRHSSLPQILARHRT